MDSQSPQLTEKVLCLYKLWICRDANHFNKIHKVSVVFIWIWSGNQHQMCLQMCDKRYKAQVRKQQRLAMHCACKPCVQKWRSCSCMGNYFRSFLYIYSFVSKTASEIEVVNSGMVHRDGKHYMSDSVIRQPSISHVSRWYWHWQSQTSKVFMLSCFDRKSPSHSVPLLSHHDKL